MIVVTLDDAEATKNVVLSLRQAHPETTIHVQGHNLEDCRQLHKLGATAVISENIEASLELACIALQEVGISDNIQPNIPGNFRHAYRQQIVEMNPPDNTK